MVGMIGVHWSHKFLAHPKVFTVAALIPMIPGVYAFKAMIALVEINHLGYTPELLSILIGKLFESHVYDSGFGDWFSNAWSAILPSSSRSMMEFDKTICRLESMKRVSE